MVKYKIFPTMIWNKTRVSAHITLIQHSTESLSSKSLGKDIRKYRDQKRRNKTVPVSRRLGRLCRQTQGF